MSVPGEGAARDSGEFVYLSPPEVNKLRAMTEEQVAKRWISVVAKQGVDGESLVNEARGLISHYSQVIAAQKNSGVR